MSLSGLETLLVAVFLLLLMLGMGATLTVAHFRVVLRRPGALLIGLASQFGWMPLIAFGLAQGLQLPAEIAIGLVVMGCSAGGTTSNFFSYLSGADLALSIAMTVTSTIAVLVMIPLVLWIYTPSFGVGAGNPDLVIPYNNVVMTLLAVLVPVGLGILLRSRSERWARRVERGGSLAGFVVLALVIIGNVMREGSRLLEIAPSIYLAASLLGPIGFALGHASGRLLGLARPQQRAVSLETGIQNAPLALGIILLSFDSPVREQVLIAPLLYGVIVVPLSAAAAGLFRLQDRNASRHS